MTSISAPASGRGVVTAGVPRRTPLVTNGLLRLVRNRVLVGGDIHFVETALQLFAGHAGRRAGSSSIRWLSVPPETSFNAASRQSLRQALWRCPQRSARRRSLKSGFKRLAEAHGLGRDDVHQRAALRAGENRLVDCLSRTPHLQRIMPPRGPRRVLCVVVVTTSAYGTGFGWHACPQPDPAMCAISTMR